METLARSYVRRVLTYKARYADNCWEAWPAIRDLLKRRRRSTLYGRAERATSPLIAPDYLRYRRLEWILRIQPERDAPQLFSYSVDVPIDVQGHRLKIAIATLEVGTLA